MLYVFYILGPGGAEREEIYPTSQSDSINTEHMTAKRNKETTFSGIIT